MPPLLLLLQAIALALGASDTLSPDTSPSHRSPLGNTLGALQEAALPPPPQSEAFAPSRPVLDAHWKAVERAILEGSAARDPGVLEEEDILVLPEGLRNAEADPASRWPGGVVPVELADEEWPPGDAQRLLEAIEDIESNSCIRFVARTDQEDYLLLRHVGFSCASIVGFHAGAGGVPSFLGRGCMRRGTIQHELLHTLGIWHEHARPDRDQYITIRWEHIRPEDKRNFIRKDPSSVRTLGLPYDYASVMHYRAVAFSKDGALTIVPKEPEALAVMGQRKRFSPLDIAKLNALYECSHRQTEIPTELLLANLLRLKVQ